ncbi:MAG: glucosamine-6-phosphate deaminase [Actinomycetota bacterium]|nr:glucosamine-6-phosphate deaminase [Actinomycetota bacterium]
MGSLRIRVVEDADELGRVGADLVAEVIAAAPTAPIVVATGRTPMGLYAELAARRRSGVLETTAISAVQLDEYLGLEPDDRRSLFGWMRRSFLEPLGVSDERVIRLPLDGDLEEACAAFDRGLEARGALDLAILGLGRNGHLGFNEPPSDAGSSTRRVELSSSTIEANARYSDDGADVPATAVTLGLRHLLSARAIVLVVSGSSKRTIVHRALEGPVGPAVPASFLREANGDVTVIVDRAAWADG